MSRLLFMSHDDVIAALEPDACRDAMAEVLAAHARGGSFFPLRNVAIPPDAAGFIGLMPGWRGAHEAADGERPAAFALKAICLMPGNPARGLDAHQGTVTLFDGDTGIPTAILDASAVTEVRTAAVTAAATRALARPGAKVLAILGSGVQGKAHLRAMGADFEEVRMYSPSYAAGAASAEEAVRGADVVVVATSAREPVLAHEWLSPGMHVNAVGASTPRNREIEVETVAAAALFCDSRESLRNEAGEFRLALEQGLIPPGDEHVRAELGEVLAGERPGRTGDDELTLFRSLGVAIEDLAAAQLAVAVARERGLGTELEL
jgi:ornithine cyclodeaminase/alanine dehydrogenase-like protein (mu-crystallin family)